MLPLIRNPFIVDSHHKVLSAWAAYRATLSIAPRLISLDHHTDTSKPFRNHPAFAKLSNPAEADSLRSKWIKEIVYSRPSSINVAIQRLSNDEHIITAIQSDIITSAFIIAHNARDTDLAIYRLHKVACYSVDRNPHSKFVESEICDTVLESDFLNHAILSFDHLLNEADESPLVYEPYILDIDLDYFNTRLSVKPIDSTTIKQLAAGAGLITIATEPDYVQTCALDKTLTSQDLLSSLLTTIAVSQDA